MLQIVLKVSRMYIFLWMGHELGLWKRLGLLLRCLVKGEIYLEGILKNVVTQNLEATKCQALILALKKVK